MGGTPDWRRPPAPLAGARNLVQDRQRCGRAAEDTGDERPTEQDGDRRPPEHWARDPALDAGLQWTLRHFLIFAS